MGAQRRKRHVTVVGAASCIGAPLCHALASQGHHVCAVDSFHDGTKRLELEATGATCVRYDLASYHDGDAAGLPEADLVYFCLWQPFHDLSEASPPQNDRLCGYLGVMESVYAVQLGLGLGLGVMKSVYAVQLEVYTLSCGPRWNA